MTLSPTQRQLLLAGIAFVLFVLLAGLALAQGLDGEFIFDDSWNLRGLEDIQRDPTWQAGLQYIMNGIASQLGRPLALATFALQYDSWAGNPENFIWVNLCLHLLTGALLTWALVALLRLRGSPPEAAAGVAVLAGALWLLAPLNASAVLYIVQRMAVLAGTCMFAGLLVYVKGRQLSAEGRPLGGLAVMTVGMGIGTAIGVMAKENAALFPLMILALEATLLADVPRPPRWNAWRAVFLWLPLVLLAAGIAHRSPGLFDTSSRNFTVLERCLTEPRVLLIYVQKMLLPSLFSIRLLYDDLEVSRSLVSPWTTLPALLAWIAALVLALRYRRREPMAAFAVLWFLSCHVLESTAIPLELAFEHRNYVALAGPLLAFAWYAARLIESPAVAKARPAIMAGLGAYIGLHALALWQTASLWGNPGDMAAFWAKRQPESKRAQYQFADHLFRVGLPGHSSLVYERMAERWPGDPAVLISEFEIACYYPDAPLPDAERVRASLARFDGQVYATLNMLDRVVHAVEEARCKRFPVAELQQLISDVLATPGFAQQRHNVLLLRSRVAASSGDYKTARAALDESIRMRPLIPLLVQGVIWSMQMGDVAAVRRYLDMADHDPAVSPLERWSHRDWLDKIRGWVAEQDAARKR